MVKRDDEVVKKLINEFRVVREGKAEKWKKCRKDEEVIDVMRELSLVIWMGVGKVAHVKLNVCSSLHFITKMVIHPFSTISMLVSHYKIRDG